MQAEKPTTSAVFHRKLGDGMSVHSNRLAASMVPAKSIAGGKSDARKARMKVP
jgi:hypothetical protein